MDTAAERRYAFHLTYAGQCWLTNLVQIDLSILCLTHCIASAHLPSDVNDFNYFLEPTNRDIGNDTVLELKYSAFLASLFQCAIPEVTNALRHRHQWPQDFATTLVCVLGQWVYERQRE